MSDANTPSTPVNDGAFVRQSSKVVYENRWMTVTEDKIRRPDGSDGIFGVVHKPDFVLIIPFDGTHFHMVQQYRYPVGDRFWEFPQGTWEADPVAKPMAAAAAELVEETGLTAACWEHLAHLYEAYGFSDQGFHIVLATDLTAGEPDRSVEEQDMVSRRVSRDEAWSLVQSGEIKDAPTIAALGLFERWSSG